MRHRGPVDFLAALVVELGGVVLLLAALPLLGPDGGPRHAATATGPAASNPTLPWQRAGNPTPWDDQADGQRWSENDPAYVENRLGQRGEQLVQSLLAQIERVLEDR